MICIYFMIETRVFVSIRRDEEKNVYNKLGERKKIFFRNFFSFISCCFEKINFFLKLLHSIFYLKKSGYILIGFYLTNTNWNRKKSTSSSLSLNEEEEEEEEIIEISDQILID